MPLRKTDDAACEFVAIRYAKEKDNLGPFIGPESYNCLVTSCGHVLWPNFARVLPWEAMPKGLSHFPYKVKAERAESHQVNTVVLYGPIVLTPINRFNFDAEDPTA